MRDRFEGQSVLFVVSSVTGNQLTRAYPFASLLAQGGRKVEIIGPAKTGSGLYIEDSNFEIRPIPRLSLRSRTRWLSGKVSRYDIVCVSKPCWEGTLAAVMAKRMGKMLIFDIDDDDPRNWFFDLRTDAGRIGPKGIAARLPEAVVIQVNFSMRVIADRLTVASHALRRKYGGQVVYVPIPSRIFEGQTRDIPGDKIVMYAGAIRAHKGIETLIEAFTLAKSQVPEAKLYLVGPIHEDSISWEGMSRRIDRVNDIFCPGFQPIQAIPKWLSKADCLVLPNPDNPIHRAQSPVKLMYYMGAHRPIVTTPVGEIPLILDEGSALFVPPDDPQSMSEAIVRVLSDPGLSRKLADASNRIFLERHCAEVMHDGIEEIYSLEGVGRAPGTTGLAREGRIT